MSRTCRLKMLIFLCVFIPGLCAGDTKTSWKEYDRVVNISDLVVKTESSQYWSFVGKSNERVHVWYGFEACAFNLTSGPPTMHSMASTGELLDLSISVEKASTPNPFSTGGSLGGTHLFMQYEFVFNTTKDVKYVLKAEYTPRTCDGGTYKKRMYFDVRTRERAIEKLMCGGAAKPSYQYYFSLINPDHVKYEYKPNKTHATLYVNWMDEVGYVKIFDNKNPKQPFMTLKTGDSFFDLVNLTRNAVYTFEITGKGG
eukprot:216016_1